MISMFFMALADFKRSLGVIDRDKSPLGSFFGGVGGDTEMGLKPTNETVSKGLLCLGQLPEQLLPVGSGVAPHPMMPCEC